MTRYLLSLILLSAFLPVNTVSADDRVDHYHAVEIATTEEAFAIIDKRVQEIDGMLSKDAPSVGDLERIHQLSYDLESAVEKLSKGAKVIKDNELADAVEGLHLESENHNLKATREWFSKVQTLYGKLK